MCTALRYDTICGMVYDILGIKLLDMKILPMEVDTHFLRPNLTLDLWRPRNYMNITQTRWPKGEVNENRVKKSAQAKLTFFVINVPVVGVYLNFKLAHSFLSHLCLSLSAGIFHLSFSFIIFSRHICSLHWPFTSYISLLYKPSFATSLFLCGPLETQHVDHVPRPVLLEDGILVIEVTVGLRPLSANTSLWPGLQLDGRVRKAQPDQSVGGTSLVGVFHRGQSGVFNP